MNEGSLLHMLRSQLISVWRKGTLFTILLVLFGALLAFTALFLIDKVSGRNIVQQTAKTKDTVYVKLVDSLAGGSFAGSRNVQDAVVNSDVNKSFQDTPRLTEAGNFPKPISIKAPPVPSFDKEQLENLSETTIPVWKWLAIPALMLMIGTGIFLSYKKLPPPNYKLNIDKDPEELTRLFERHSLKIEMLGNPRKIKRFSNKLRFQYHYLKNQSLINNEAQLDVVLLTLLFIEGNLQKMNLELLSEDEKKNPLAWFKKMLVNEVPGIIDDKLAKQLLQLNKNVIA
jgi:hypothetical protein